MMTNDKTHTIPSVVVAHLNKKYDTKVIFSECCDAEEIVKDLITPILPDNSSGLTIVTLLHLSPDDIEALAQLNNPTLIKPLLNDLTTLNRRVCRQLVDTIKEKIQMDGDAFRLEHILRKTVADLEGRKRDLEASLSHEKEELKELKNQANLQREENLRLQLKLKQAKEHLIGAGIFQSAEMELELPHHSERINNNKLNNTCNMDQRLSSNKAAPLSLERQHHRPEWRY